MRTDATQSDEDYRVAQDVTAPPDPVAAGATSDVPIHGEKTNVLFHPTPSVSYEPMFEALEARANVMCAGVLLAIVFVGKMFGGSLWGLVPLGVAVTSGVFLWVKDVIRQGRQTEWASEVGDQGVVWGMELTAFAEEEGGDGGRESDSRVGRVVEYGGGVGLGVD